MIKCDINLLISLNVININSSVSFLVIFLPFLYDFLRQFLMLMIFENVDDNIPLIKRYGDAVENMDEMAGGKWEDDL